VPKCCSFFATIEKFSFTEILQMEGSVSPRSPPAAAFFQAGSVAVRRLGHAGESQRREKENSQASS
jgi:hypothetical protein